MTHPDPESPLPPDDRVELLLRSMTDADLPRDDPPAGLLDSILDEVATTRSTGSTRSWSDRTRFLAAAATVLVFAAVSGLLLARDDDQPATRLLASARLEQQEPLGSTAATARLVRERDGRTHLVIRATDMAPAPAGEDYELWLIDRGVTDPRSLGVVTGSGDIVVPTNIDPSEYPIVDISLEKRDGDHQHSGHSLMRGTLQ